MMTRLILLFSLSKFSLCLSVRPSVCLPPLLSVYLSVRLCVCVCLSLSDQSTCYMCRSGDGAISAESGAKSDGDGGQCGGQCWMCHSSSRFPHRPRRSGTGSYGRSEVMGRRPARDGSSHTDGSSLTDLAVCSHWFWQIETDLARQRDLPSRTDRSSQTVLPDSETTTSSISDSYPDRQLGIYSQIRN